MSNETVALIGFISLFSLMLLRVPVGMAMGLVGITGFGYLTGFEPALKLVGQTTMRTVTDYSFGVIPMFLLMGAFVSVSGISRELLGFVPRGAPPDPTYKLRRFECSGWQDEAERVGCAVRTGGLAGWRGGA